MNERQWVAVIDDDESVRTSLSRILGCADIEASGFGSGEEFLLRADGSEPTCLVLDIHLGSGLNGFELKERLEAEGRAPPIIFMTGHADIPLPERWKPGGAVDCLRKPFATEELLSRVRCHLRAALNGSPAVSEAP